MTKKREKIEGGGWKLKRGTEAERAPVGIKVKLYLTYVFVVTQAVQIYSHSPLPRSVQTIS